MFLFCVFNDYKLCIHGDEKRKCFISLVLECEFHVYFCLVLALHEEWWIFACLDWCTGLLEDEVS
jgi:hypothetical protein